jgi:hypothetical protein
VGEEGESGEAVEGSEDATEIVIASVVWRVEELYGIVLVRRRDGAVALADVPVDLADDLTRFDREAVVRRGYALRGVVQWALGDPSFSLDRDFGKSGLKNGAKKAELGLVRRFNSFLVGVDIGEFELSPRHRWN